MRNGSTPDRLKEIALELEKNDGVGLLVSGGSDRMGRVPLKDFYDGLRWIKDNTDLIINLHTGLIGIGEAEEIAETRVDIVSVDVVGSDDTIKKVYGLNASTEDYEMSIRTLRRARISHIVPHICVGLDFGEIRGEYKALELIQKYDPSNIVILGLIPTPGTPMSDIKPPSVEVLTDFISKARELCPDSEISLGCMRAKQEKKRLERSSIEAGATRIVLPSRSTIEWSLERGYRIKIIDGCCSIPEELEEKALRRVLP
jgi:hypothetical protein